METDLKLEQRNVMMEIQLMAMDVSLIEVQLNLHGFVVEDLLLPKILELSALLDYYQNNLLNPTVCVPHCGDGLRAGTEKCDDGNTANSDGCKSD